MSLCFVLVLVVKKRKGCNEADALSPMRRDGTSITSGRECGRERSSLGANLCNGERMPLVCSSPPPQNCRSLALSLCTNAKQRNVAMALWLTLVEWVDINQGCFPRLDFPRS